MSYIYIYIHDYHRRAPWPPVGRRTQGVPLSNPPAARARGPRSILVFCLSPNCPSRNCWGIPYGPSNSTLKPEDLLESRPWTSKSLLTLWIGHTCMLVKSYQNGVSHNAGRFAQDVLPLFAFACHNISRMSCHARRRAAGFRQKHVLRLHKRYDLTKLPSWETLGSPSHESQRDVCSQTPASFILITVTILRQMSVYHGMF